MIWFAGVMFAAALGVAAWWWPRRVDALGRPRSFPVVSVLLLVGLGSGLLVPVVRNARLEHRLSAAAGSLTGVPVVVHCQTMGQQLGDLGSELGFVRYGPDGTPERATLIKRAQCGHLRAYLRSDRRRPTAEQVVAVHVLSHEAMHMAGVTGEAEAECRAVQLDARTARLLGAPEDAARELARRYWRTIYPRMPDDYRSASCAPGGDLDQRAPDAPWAG
ncbi:hypothetical protein [Oryzihumus sp.]